jgi:hypothetical protein
MWDFLEKCQDLLNQTIWVFAIFLKIKVEKTIQYIKDYDYEMARCRCFVYANSLSERIKKQGIYLYEHVEEVKMVVDCFHHANGTIHSYAERRKIEPLAESWICVSSLCKQHESYKNYNLVLLETYEKLADVVYDENDKQSMEMMAKQFEFMSVHLRNEITNVVEKENSFVECLMTMRYGKSFIYRDCWNDGNRVLKEISFEKSKVKFISVEYSSPEYEKPIVFELRRGDYLINNELFSAAFVKRTLEYYVPFSKFNMNYTINIIDNKLNSVKLSAGQFILLDETEYQVITKTKPEPVQMDEKLKDE